MEWQKFTTLYPVTEFGVDGYFTRSVKQGLALFNNTHKAAWRFTRKTTNDTNNSCASCHQVEQLAYAFVQSDRYDSNLEKRVSFEERISRCYIKYLDGFAPTIYDPAIRDLRILARFVANRLHLTEGSLVTPP